MQRLYVIGVLTLLVSVSSTYNVRLKRTYYGRGCRDPGKPVNGFSWFSSRRTGSVVVHSCKPGYALLGPKLRVCQPNGKWSLSLPRCASASCDNPPSPPNAFRIFSSRKVNSVVKYRCHEGYKLIGSSYRVCKADGKWSGVPAKCVGTKCGKLLDPDNGRVEVSSNRAGGTATYFCNDGYTLVGESTRLCRESGLWAGTMPSCRAVECSQLRRPQNGDVSVSGTTVGSVATYTCNSGYSLDGAMTRTCRGDGEWSGVAPVCRPSSCGLLNDIPNGKVVVSGTTPGSVATYSCNAQFNLVGGARRKCLNNGEWSGVEPFCQRIMCEALTGPDNGIIELRPPAPQSPGDTAIYRCNSGFTLISGNRKRVCQSDGTYSGVAPSCQVMRCGNLRDPVNGEVSVSGNSIGDEAMYSCNRGFVLFGESRRLCSSNGIWSGSEPTCRPVDCGTLPNPDNGRVTITTTKFAGAAKYRCNDGFMLVGVALRRCTAGGVWSGDAPTCKASSCGPLISPANGVVTISGTNIGDTASYSCNRGYRLVGKKLRRCLTGARWSGRAPTCTAITCEPVDDITNGRVSVSGTTPGAIATYTCNKGFDLIGQRTRRCQQDGSFSGREPFCRGIVCESLPDISNGQVTVSGATVGSVATYSCNSGFTLVGQSTRICQNDGSFSGRAPFCKSIQCEQLSNPDNGRVLVGSGLPGSIAHYICNPGFELVGQQARTCDSNGKYSGTAPTCRAVDCGSLSNPSNGVVEFSSTTVSSVATYTCNTGYNINGARTRICAPNGQWSGQAPVCIIVDCGQLFPPTNGNVDFTSTTYLSKATYTCRRDYELVGTETRTCEASGQWSGSVPFCRGVSCEVLDNPENGLVVVEGNGVGTVATYTCNPGFSLVGQSVRVCRADGTYSGTAPTCRGNRCSVLTDPPNGIVKFSSTSVGATASYACDKGYILEGSSVRVCQQNGEWSSQEPVCRIVECEVLTAPANGGVEAASYQFGSVAVYYCEDDYVLVGDKSRTCQFNTQWSGEAPYCRIIDCGGLEAPSYGIVRLSGTTAGSIASYSCNPGFELVGLDQRVCEDNGVWSGIAPSCTSLSCDDLTDPAYGSVMVSGVGVGSIATYTCDKGFRLVGRPVRVCQPSSKWSGAAPTCEPEDCGELDDPDNGAVEYSGTAFWDTATYTCNQGYDLVGDAIRTCEQMGHWSGVAPFCRAASCGSLDSPKNGLVSFKGVTVGSIAEYSCFPGYLLVGVSKRTCGTNGQWSDEAPVCQAVDCGPLFDPDNGQVKVSGTSVYSTATYTCDRGFGLVGVNQRVCQANGVWSGETPVCEPSQCGELDFPDNGMVTTTGTQYWDTATYSCMLGYLLIGDDTRTCNERGVWSGEPPICVAVDCGPLTPPSNGLVDFKFTTYRSTAAYSCNDGYDLVGDRTRMCLESGTWSGTTPVCQRVMCDALSAPSNGQLYLTNGNLVNSVATYNCDPGFTLDGNRERTCQSDGTWSGSNPSCVAVQCDSLSSPAFGSVVLSDGTNVGSIARYSCVSDYTLSGASTRECLPNGQWSLSQPQCVLSGCGPLSDPLNGRVEFSSTNVGSRATYYCNDGFELVGDRYRVCSSNGQWSGDEPACKSIDCGDLDPPVDGSITLSGTSAGSIATYTCNFGFNLKGSSVRECLITGQWSLEAPLCQAIDCGPLTPPINGDIRVSDTTFGATARYSCSPGYELEGLSVRVCEISGRWSGSAPICKFSECPRLSDIDNGHVVLSGTTVGSIATYSCVTGYELVGKSTRVCRDDNSWNGEEPFCKVIDCGPLFDPDNGKVHFTDTTFGSLATYRCNDGHTLQGTSQRTCLASGQWSDREPLCIRDQLDCEQLTDPANGRVFVSGTTSGSTATYICQHGYSIVGDDIRYCGSDGEWSGSDPVCRSIDCGPLDPPVYGEIRFIGTGFGAIARYSCIHGYRLVGGASRTCQSDGYWSGQAPVCELDGGPPPPPPRGCGDPGTPANGFKEGSDYDIGSTVYYSCADGYRLVGALSILCQFNGEWSDSVPQCISDQGCVDGVKVEDACGRLCSCEGGNLVDCCRHRKDFTSLTDEEKQRYIDAVLTVFNDPQYKSEYIALLDQYADTHGTVAQGSNYDTSQFFVWNRYFLLAYEDLLRKVDCRVTIPYYDWSVLPQVPYRSLVWDDELGFGKSSRSTDYCVNSGPFKYDEYHLTPAAGGGCLKREYKDEVFPSRNLIDRDILTLPAKYFDEFHRTLHLFVHSNIRCFVGGTMCTRYAANDPVFVLHLAMIDYIFDRWQRFNEENLRIRYYDDQTALVLVPQYSVTDYHDNDDLPNGEAVCYAEPNVKNHITPGGYAFAAAHTAPVPTHMTCSNGLDELELGDEAMDYLKGRCSRA